MATSKIAMSVGAPTSPECACELCRSACERTPPPYLPAQAAAAIDAGLAPRLMLGYCYNRENRLMFYLIPAVVGHERRRAPTTEEVLKRCGLTAFEARMFPSRCKQGRCTFLTNERLCELHHTPYKPDTCRQTLVCHPQRFDAGLLHPLEQAKLWQTFEGLALIERWKRLVNFDERTISECH